MELKTRDELFTEKYGVNPATIKSYFHIPPSAVKSKFDVCFVPETSPEEVNKLVIDEVLRQCGLT